ncbi:SapC family protein [uncultured Phenylobacterium sp.]|uniref:SapC family protein n=1 Tax=uncultured Phenylobacterium sp. TaxID=349273 RepID=UPI0025F034B2|nr:SapC family protein [uncultured Phenylobacterium sp.]
MFKSLVALSPQKHAHLRLTSTAHFQHLSEEVSCPIMASEVVNASRSFPIVFQQDNATYPLALVAAEKGRNAFIDDEGRWTAGHLPLHFRRYPFTLGEHGKSLVLMIDESAPSLSTSDGQPLFVEEKGKAVPAAWLRDIQKELFNLTRLHRATQALCAPLSEYNVLVARILSLKVNGKARQIRGLRIIDMDRVHALPDDTLAAWARSGLLALVYAHTQSLANLKRFSINSIHT